jgi:hypothetical protein
MNDIFRPYLRKFVLVFFDDILIYSKSPKDHLKHLRAVLEMIQQHLLYVKVPFWVPGSGVSRTHYLRRRSEG